MEICKLSDICEIQSGLVINRKVATDEKKKYKYKSLSLRSLNEGYVNIDFLEEFESKERISEKLMTNEGDIIFRLFAPFSSFYIRKSERGFVVPNQFCIMRVKDKILPEYLNAIINLNIINLNNYIEGAGQIAQKILKISNIKEINIPVIDMEKQILIGKVYSEQNKLNNLYRELLSEENKRLSELIKQILEK